jgi:phosphoglycolate phosphatase
VGTADPACIQTLVASYRERYGERGYAENVLYEGVPEALAALRARHGLDERSAMIGDRAVDLVAARRNGLRSGAVTWGHGSREELLAESPDWVFERPADWLRVV